MRDSDQELIRQVLSSILERLGEGAGVETRITGGASPNQGSTHRQPRLSAIDHDESADNPIILVVMNQANKQSNAVKFDATHPVFERFPVAEEETSPPAPKTCFMEPGRVCVNSGACEMRGY